MGRTRGLAVMACGILCYLAFLGAFGYLVAFVGDLGVPRSIAVGPAVPWPEALARDAGLLLAFGLQHSLMARPGCKRAWARALPPGLERSAYVLGTCLVLAALYSGWRPLPVPVWEMSAAPARAALRGLSFLGWAVALVSSFHLSHAGLFGLEQAWRESRGLPPRDTPFRTPGLYRLVRHPLMLGFLLAFWATPRMDAGHLLFAAAMTGYILAGTRFEERDLRRSLGEAYADYCRRVPMLLPWPRRLAPGRRRP